MSPDRPRLKRAELGVVRLCPVAGVVVFPHTSEALHLTHPADRLLVDDALAGDRLVVLASLAPGGENWQTKAASTPPVQPMACLARIAAWSGDAETGYTLLLWGIARARIVRQFQLASGLHQAQVELCGDVYPADEARQAALHERLHRILADRSDLIGLGGAFLSPIGQHVPLGVLTDMVAQGLDLSRSQKAALLAECNVHRRAELLLGYLAILVEAPGRPPVRQRLDGDRWRN